MTDQRFRRQHRLLRQKDFDRVFSEGRRGGAAGMTILVRPSPDGVSRLGLVVSRKFGKAVTRNRARRLIREAFRQSRADFPQPLEIVVLPQAGRFPDRMQEVREGLRRAIERALRSARS